MIGAATSVVDIAAAVTAGKTTARDVAEAALARIAAGNDELNCFTTVLGDVARADAGRVDARLAAGADPGPLAGVPFAVKNLFDIAGVVTLAGSKIDAGRPPATRDATVVAALRRAGAVLCGALNMDEYAYGFSTENTHYGPARNPHDRRRMAGGSSGGSAAAVAAGLVPLALGTDTNGSIRVPAALCGVFGLKPTYGRLSRRGVTLFAPSFDHVGPLARTVRDLAVAYDVMQGFDPEDPAAADRPIEPTAPQLHGGIAGLRVAIAGEHFERGAEPAALEAVASVATALGVSRRVTLPDAHRARAAAMLITATEGATLQLPNLRTRFRDFDPMTRHRFAAGALLPGTFAVQAQRLRAWFRARVLDALREIDVLLAPTTPYPAPEIGAPPTTRVAGMQVITRAHLGVFTQPLSFIGLPVISVPVPSVSALPLGVQLVARPWNEAALFRVAAHLEATGIAFAPDPGSAVRQVQT